MKIATAPCDLCDRSSTWRAQLRYIEVVVRLCRACYALYLRTVYPELM